MNYDIVIIGAGAAGLVSAYRAITKNPQLNILVLEKEHIPGRKLNASGNGKCNLANSDFRSSCYHSDSIEFIEKWNNQHSYKEIVSFFREVGVLLYEKNGYYYPISNQAKQISTLLYEKSKMLGVDYRFNTRVKNICKITKNKKQYYEVIAYTEDRQEQSYKASYVLLATGGYASAKLGGCKDGYKLATSLGMHCNAIYPVLSPIYVEDKDLSLAKGVRLDGKVTLKLWNGDIVKETGQIQFNDNNLSGIVMMNLSCYLNCNKEAVSFAFIHIDVLPQYSWEELKAFFVTQQASFANETLETLLKGILPVGFVLYITKRLNLDKNQTLDCMTEKQINRLTSILKKLEYTPIYVDDFDKAQVTGGGISTDEISVDTFECKKHRQLYLVGEVLDVNGKCGGYNLTFSMLSGIQAIDSILDKL